MCPFDDVRTNDRPSQHGCQGNAAVRLAKSRAKLYSEADLGE
jgi:hypothetical protein